MLISTIIASVNCAALFILIILWIIRDYQREVKDIDTEFAEPSIRKQLADAENQFNNADKEHVDSAIYNWKAVSERANAYIREQKEPLL